MRLAVVGHTEYVHFGHIQRLPNRGEVLHATNAFSDVAGSGAGAAAVLARLADTSTFFTAVGDDKLADAATGRLAELGVRVHAAARRSMTRQAVALSDSGGERTIVTLGDRLQPQGTDPLPWDELERADAVLFVAGDQQAYGYARRCPLLVSTPRASVALADQEAPPDVVVFSEADQVEADAMHAARSRPRVLVQTNGAKGGSWSNTSGAHGDYAAAPPPGPIRDSYGAGDTFAAALTCSLARSLSLEDALAQAAAEAAACLTWWGPYPSSAQPRPD